MDIQKKPTLAEKQAFWAEQLPKFESKYWLPSHFEFLVFDMDQGNYVIKDGLDPTFDDDATEIWHRVNTGWAMWKKAINFTKAQAVPEGYVLVKKVHPDAIVHNQGLGLFKECQVIYGWDGKSKDFKDALNKGFYHGVKLGAKAVLETAMIEAQESAND